MKRVIACLLAIAVMLCLAACKNEAPEQVVEKTQLGDWAATTQWTADGENLKLDSTSGSYAYHTGIELEDIFDISVAVGGDGLQEAGVVLGNKKQEPIVDIRLVFEDGKASVKAGYTINDMEKEILVSNQFDVPEEVTLKVSKSEGDRKLKVGVFAGEQELYSATAEEIPSLAARSVRWAGLCGKGTVTFSSISITTEDPSEKYIVSEINPQPHIENENYVFGDGAICNKDADGNDVIIVDSQTGESAAWNVNCELGGAWTLKTRAQVGQCADSSGGARFAFGDAERNIIALITCRVDPISYTLMFENAQDATNNWINTAGASKWFPMTTAAFDIVITRHAGENCLYIQISDVTGEILYAVQTGDYPEGVLDNAKYFGFYVWQTQTQYSNIQVDAENATEITIKDNSFIEGITDTQYMSFDRKQTTDAWEIVPDVYYQKGSQAGDALLFNADADATAKLKKDLGSSFKVSMDIRYLLNYDENSHSRLFFWGEEQRLPFIMDIRINMGTFLFGAQYQYDGAWTDNLFPGVGGSVLGNDIRIEFSRAAGDDRILVRLLDTDGTVLMEQYSPQVPNIDDIHYLEIHSSETVTIFDNIVVE